MQKKESDSHNNQIILRCSVKNCRKLIEPGTEIKIGEDIYCHSCGTLLLRATLGL